MSIPESIASYLEHREVPFEVVTHATSMTSLETAQRAHVPAARLAKGVLVENGESFVLAVVPATHRLDCVALGEVLQCDIHKADAADLDLLFRDCSPGAVPSIGAPYGLRTVVDRALDEQPDVYLEGGDHQHLIHVSRTAFARLMKSAEHAWITYTG